MTDMGQVRMVLFPCKHCRQTVKTTLTNLTTGKVIQGELKCEDHRERPVGSGQGQVINPGGKGHPPPVRPPDTRDGPVYPRRVEDSSHPGFLRTEKEDADYIPTMEALGANWRRSLTILPQEREYLEEAKKPFADHMVEKVAELGSMLVIAAGGFVEAGKQIQEIRMRALRPNLEFIEEYGYLYPAIHDPVCEVFTTGANPLLQTVLPATCTKDEKPHDEKLTPVILQTLWEDVQDGSLFLCHRDVIPSTEFIAASSTGAVPKKNPDRAISAKVRITSDLRRVNLSLKRQRFFLS